MAIRVLKEVNRLPGYSYSTTTTMSIIAGQPVVLESAGVIKPYKADTSETLLSTLQAACLGLATDTTAQFEAGSGLPGAGYDYTNYARGNLVGVFCNGGVFELYDDGRGSPLVITDSFLINEPVYVSCINGKISNTTTASIGAGVNPIGSVVAVTGAGATLHVTIKLDI